MSKYFTSEHIGVGILNRIDDFFKEYIKKTNHKMKWYNSSYGKLIETYVELDRLGNAESIFNDSFTGEKYKLNGSTLITQTFNSPAVGKYARKIIKTKDECHMNLNGKIVKDIDIHQIVDNNIYIKLNKDFDIKLYEEIETIEKMLFYELMKKK